MSTSTKVALSPGKDDEEGIENSKLCGLERNVFLAMVGMAAIIIVTISAVASLDEDGKGYEHTFSSLPAFIIVLRETLEATVLLAVLIQYLQRAGQEAADSKEDEAAANEMKRKFSQYNSQVYWGAAAGGLGTVVFGTIILSLYYSAEAVMPPKVAYIVEGVLLLFASIELTYFFVTHLAPGMKSDNQWKKKWEINLGGLVNEVIKDGERKKFFWLTANTVFREGFEAVIFITPFAPLAPPWALTIAGILGLIVGLFLGMTTFMGSQKMDLTKFFIAAAVFFLFMSAGLLSHSSYEFQKAGIYGTWACDGYNQTGSISGDDGGASTAPVDGYRYLAEVYDDCMPSSTDDGEVGDDFFAYRRLGSSDDLFKRSKSCDCYKNEEVAWVNMEVWDITDCCDIGFEGSGLFFFVLMILFWYRPQMSRLELIAMCIYWPFALSWGYYKVRSIHAYNETLNDEPPVAEAVAVDGEMQMVDVKESREEMLEGGAAAEALEE
uniref:Iron permease FTR1 n=1 Tax=Octactis speculum TaxID=3111310 RepID=A0A7S2F5W1_9STRA